MASTSAPCARPPPICAGLFHPGTPLVLVCSPHAGSSALARSALGAASLLVTTAPVLHRWRCRALGGRRQRSSIGVLRASSCAGGPPGAAGGRRAWWKSPLRFGSGVVGALLGLASRTRVAAKGQNAPLEEEDPFIPYGCDADGFEDCGHERTRFEDSLPLGLVCPPRLRGRDADLVEQVNRWHFAMLNDPGRNRFFWDALEACVKGRRVLDLGAGAGLLSIMAARLGASEVIAIEASSTMVELARANIKQNQLEDKITVLHGLSNLMEFDPEDRAEVVVSETMGTILNGESIADYLPDAYERLAFPGSPVIPAGGAQYCMLVSSPTIERATGVFGKDTYHGVDLSAMRGLQDTVSSMNSWALQLPTLTDLVPMSERVPVFELDFARCQRTDIPLMQEVHVQALQTGTIHAAIASWEVWSDPQRTHKITTHLEDEQEAGPGGWVAGRGAHWGQALQVLEASDGEEGSLPEPLHVVKGESLLLRIRHSSDRTAFQISVHRADGQK